MINKRLISNLSIESEIKEKKVQLSGERLEFVTMKKMREKKEVDPAKHIHYISYHQNNLFLRLRKNRKQSAVDFSNRIWINSVVNPNPHLRPDQITEELYFDSEGNKQTGMLINHIELAIERMVNKNNGRGVDPDEYRSQLLKKVDNLSQKK